MMRLQGLYNLLKILDSGACPGPDPGFAGMTEKGLFRLFTNSFRSIFPISLKPLLSAIFCRSGSKAYSPLLGWHESG